MSKRTTSHTLVVLCAVVMGSGCMPKMTMDEMKHMKPERPTAALAHLNHFAGHWVGEGEMTMAGLDEVIKSTSSMDGRWEGDGWYLVINGTFKMGELGEMKATETWTYDTHDKLYRSTWVDSMGSVGTGKSTYDESTRTWKMTAVSHGPFGKTTMKGTAKMIDDNTMEWTWAEYAMGGLMKTMEMKGTNRRR